METTERRLPVVPQARGSPRTVFAILAIVLPVAVLGMAAFWLAIPHPAGYPLLGLAIFIAGMLFLGALGIRSARSDSYPAPTEVRVNESGVTVEFPGKGAKTVLWTNPPRNLGVTHVDGIQGLDGKDQMYIEGPWPAAIHLSYDDGMWLLDEARRKGLRVEQHPDGRYPFLIHFKIVRA